VASPSVAVVVPTHNRHQGLARCLDALAAQDRHPDEIVVVDDGSSPAVEVPTRLGGVAVTVLRNDPPSGPAVARNRGWRATGTELVLFTDDDCRPSAGWVEVMAAAAEPGAVLVGRTVPDPQDGPERSPFDRSLRVETCDGSFPTANIAYPREVLERLGGFDESFLLSYGEDTDLGQRALTAGCSGRYVGDAIVYHAVHRRSLRGSVAERRRLGELARLVAAHPRLRTDLWDGLFWNTDHRWLVTGAVGAAASRAMIAGALRTRGGPVARAAWLGAAAAALLPGARYAYWCRRRSLALASEGWLPGALGWFVLDTFEVAMLARGSVRYRSLLL
jgi:GT2 family glycosyltransferase